MTRKILVFTAAPLLLLTWFAFGFYLGRKHAPKAQIFDAEIHHWIDLPAVTKLYCLDPDAGPVPCIEYGTNAAKTILALEPLTDVLKQFEPPEPSSQNQVEK